MKNGGNIMGHSYNNRMIEPYLYSCDSIITEVNNEFIDFTGFTMNELLGKSLIEIGNMLKINSQILLDNIDSENSAFIFTKLLGAREVNILLFNGKEKNEKRYIFIEKANSRLEDKLIFVEQTFIENLSGVAVYSVPDSILLKANQRYLDFLNSPFKTEESIIGRPVREFMTGFVGSQVEAVWNTVSETEKTSYTKEMKFDESDKCITYWDYTQTPILENRKMKYRFVTATEVTEKVLKNQKIEEQNKVIQQQKEQLEGQKRELEAIIENISDGISIFDNKGKYILFNKSAREMFFPAYEFLETIGDAYKQSEFYGISGERINLENIPTSRVMRGEKIRNMIMELKFPNKKLKIDVSGTPIFDGEGKFVLGVISSRDMTDYFTHEEEVRSRYEFLSRIIDTFDLPVLRLSCPGFKIEGINKKAFSITKLLNPSVKSIKQLKEHKIEDLFKAFKTNDYCQCFSDVLKEKKTKYLNKMKHFINGNEIYWNVIFEPMLEVNGELQEILILIIDVTAEINSNIAMEKAMKSHEEFFANVSHELKTPLNVIFATAQLLDMYSNNGSLDERRTSIIKYIDSIKQNSYRLSKLINNIVDLSKIEAGFFELNLSNNNIVEVVEEIVMSVTNFTEIKGLNIIFDTDTEEKIIACDAEKIERIILNLISNAIKFSEAGDEIFVDIKDKNEFVEISVKDNGIGLEANNLDMIFDRFKQVDKSLSRNAEGTGIGLSLVKSIVELHGGNIYVESKLGVGSKFTVILPTQKVKNENMLFSSKISNKSENIQVELSDV